MRIENGDWDPAILEQLYLNFFDPRISVEGLEVLCGIAARHSQTKPIRENQTYLLVGLSFAL